MAGYRVWQSLGRQVDKGQRGIRILAPIVRRTDLNEEQVAAMPSDAPVPSGPVRKVVGYRPTYVWDVAQTSGKPLAAPPQSATAVTGQAPDSGMHWQPRWPEPVSTFGTSRCQAGWTV